MASTRRALRVAAACALGALAACARHTEERPSDDWVHAVHFHGNQHFGKGAILEHLALEQTSWVPFSSKKYLDPVSLETDRARVEAYYRARGFFAAKVTNVVVGRLREHVVDVDISVDEGVPVRLRSVNLVGLDGVPPPRRRRVLAKLPLRVGEVFDHEQYLEHRSRLGAHLQAEGYAWAKVTGEALVDRDTHTADVKFSVEPGPEVRFGALSFNEPDRSAESGSPVDNSLPQITPRMQKQLRRRATFGPGDRFSPSEIEATRGRFEAVGLYSFVRLVAVPHPGQPQIADVRVELRSGSRNELRVGLGFGLERIRQELHVPFTYTRHGFLGGLRTLRARLRTGYVAVPTFLTRDLSGPSAIADATITQPDFLLRNLELRGTAGYGLDVQYAFKYHGPNGQVALQYARIHDRLVFGLSYNFQYLQFYDLANPQVFNDPALARTFLGYTNPYRLAFVVEQATVDLRDRSIEPRKGALILLLGEQGVAALGSGFTYYKLLPDGRVYIPAGSRVVFAGRVQWGAIWPAAGEGSPITQRLYLGGADSHRGFGYYRLAPQVESADRTYSIPVGGDRLFLAQAEARVDIFRIAGGMVGGTVFFDAGDVPDRNLPIDFGQLHLATGFGLRYRTVVGVVRADLGIRLNRLAPVQPDGRINPDPGERFSFHLSLGEAF